MVKKKLEKFFNSFSKKKIMIIGDVMIDSYMWGSVDRISPEAPIPIVSVGYKENRLGGAANVALNIQALGAQAILCSVIGNDSMGKSFIDLLEKNKLTSEGIIKSDRRVTTIKTRVISGSQQLLRVDEEISTPVEEESEHEFIIRILDIITKDTPDAIIFQDYDKGSLTPVIIEAILAKANEENIPVLVDPKKRNFNFYKNVTLFKPNFKELKEGLNVDLNKYETGCIFKAIEPMHKDSKMDLIMVTLSEGGIFISDGKKHNVLPAEVRDIADVSGAGDTVISVASLCVSENLDPIDIAAISNIAGGLVCEKAGVVPIDKEQFMIECLEAYSD